MSLVLTVLTVGLVNAARRVRSTTVTAVTTTMTTPASFIGRQLGFAGQPEGQCQRLQGRESRVFVRCCCEISNAIRYAAGTKCDVDMLRPYDKGNMAIM